MGIRLAAVSEMEVRAASFGDVRSALVVPDAPWDARIRTLFCPRVFGPCASYVCECGEFEGKEDEGVLCHVCGTKVGDAEVMRRRRFGHLNLRVPVPHPIVPEAMISCLPILPVALRETGQARDLNQLYANVVRAVINESNAAVVALAVRQLFQNEECYERVERDGWVLRSLSYFASDVTGISSPAPSAYLFALCLKLDYPPRSSGEP